MEFLMLTLPVKWKVLALLALLIIQIFSVFDLSAYFPGKSEKLKNMTKRNILTVGLIIDL